MYLLMMCLIQKDKVNKKALTFKNKYKKKLSYRVFFVLYHYLLKILRNSSGFK